MTSTTLLVLADIPDGIEDGWTLVNLNLWAVAVLEPRVTKSGGLVRLARLGVPPLRGRADPRRRLKPRWSSARAQPRDRGGCDEGPAAPRAEAVGAATGVVQPPQEDAPPPCDDDAPAEEPAAF